MSSEKVFKSLRNEAKYSGQTYIWLCSIDHEKQVKVSKQNQYCKDDVMIM